MPKGKCDRHGADRPCTCAMGNLYRFVEPVVLLLLKQQGPSYGYELATALSNYSLTDASIERAALYRTLKQLECNGNVSSEWDVTGSGPARHIYRITAAGEEHLIEWGVVMNNLSMAMSSFVEEVNALKEE